MRPRWMRNHSSCPECGKVLEQDQTPAIINKVRHNPRCPFCGVEWGYQDFWDYQHEKWGHEPGLRFDDEEPETEADDDQDEN